MASSPGDLIKNITFDLCFLSWVLMLTIVCMRGVGDDYFRWKYPPCIMENSEWALVDMCAFPYLVALFGVLAEYVRENHEEPSKLEVVWYPTGGILFLASGIIQIVNHNNIRKIVGYGEEIGDRFMPMIVLHLIVAILLLITAGLAFYKTFFK